MQPQPMVQLSEQEKARRHKAACEFIDEDVDGLFLDKQNLAYCYKQRYYLPKECCGKKVRDLPSEVLNLMRAQGHTMRTPKDGSGISGSSTGGSLGNPSDLSLELSLSDYGQQWQQSTLDYPPVSPMCGGFGNVDCINTTPFAFAPAINTAPAPFTVSSAPTPTPTPTPAPVITQAPVIGMAPIAPITETPPPPPQYSDGLSIADAVVSFVKSVKDKEEQYKATIAQLQAELADAKKTIEEYEEQYQHIATFVSFKKRKSC